MNSFFRNVKRLMQSGRSANGEAQIEEELRFHLEEETEELRERGLAGDDAHRAARLDLGNVTLVREETRATWTWTWMEQLGQDLRYALRMMAANKMFSALAILSLALGIGANTAIFSFMDSILLRSLPVSDPQSLVLLSWHTPSAIFHGSDRHDDDFLDPNGGYVGGAFSYAAFQLLQQNDSVFSSVFGYQGAGKCNLTFHGESDLAATETVSGNYFTGLRTQPAAGRLLGPDDDRAGFANVTVISYALSERRFGGPENAVGQSILVNNLPFTIIGVGQSKFFGADPDQPPDIYVPLHATLFTDSFHLKLQHDELTEPDFDWIIAMARLRPGVTAMQAQSAAAGSFHEFERSAEPGVKSEEIPRLLVRGGAAGLDSLRREYSKPLYILLALVGLTSPSRARISPIFFLRALPPAAAKSRCA